MSRYQSLGWSLAIISARDGADLGLNLELPEEGRWQHLADLGLNGLQVNLAIHTGAPSHLLVLEVNKGEGTLALDQMGDWRSRCVAELGNCREQHYYNLKRDRQPPTSHFQAQGVMIYGADGLILAPPSIEPESREPWRWLTPPWEASPEPPKPAVWQYLRELRAIGGTPESPPWEDIYRIVAPYETVLKALLMPPSEMDKYYLDIMMTAMAAGLRDRQLLLGLLWHAPHGDARSNGERWNDLQRLLPESGGPLSEPEAQAGAIIPLAGGLPGLIAVPAPPAAPLDSPGLALGMEEMARQMLGEKNSRPAPAKFEKNVSGQFFQLLAALGERVIVESCRHEKARSGLEAKANEVDRMLAEIERCFTPAAAGTSEAKPAPPPTGDHGTGEIPWNENNPARQKPQKLQEAKSLVQDFLNNNPDLAGDRSKVQMVLFCLKNYVSINPENGGLSFGDKLEKAGQMARNFLGQPARPRQL
jgi:hypothetical protein